MQTVVGVVRNKRFAVLVFKHQSDRVEALGSRARAEPVRTSRGVTKMTTMMLASLHCDAFIHAPFTARIVAELSHDRVLLAVLWRRIGIPPHGHRL